MMKRQRAIRMDQYPSGVLNLAAALQFYARTRVSKGGRKKPRLKIVRNKTVHRKN